MKRLFQASLGALAALAVSGSGAFAGFDFQKVAAYQYAVKFVCGKEPQTGAALNTIINGDYRTAINVLNTTDTVASGEKIVIYSEGGTVSPGPFDGVAAGQAREISCESVVDDNSVTYATGFILLQSCGKPIHVSAVYSGRGEDAEDVSLDVQQIWPLKIWVDRDACFPDNLD